MTAIEPRGARGDLKKAVLRADDGAELPLHFNPIQLVVQKGATWNAPPTRGAIDAPPADFAGTKGRIVTLVFTLDAPSTGRDVAADAALLQSWCNPTQKSIEEGRPQPPLLKLEWTNVAVFEAYLTSANVTYKLFRRDGSPLRAEVESSLTESAPRPTQPQNPSSGGPPGNRTHVLGAGETLQSLAYREYRDAKLWRGLALFNGVDDPLRLRPGRRLDLPPAPVVRELTG